ncbi:dienelactone hydrolase family protein [Leptolyngbya iicbica]|uniref:Alpha/beta fold hydrolase n=2 Tax=Cyanophyceae TaxID=3028117 RepID=A0A4Q7EA79_9CYAN|nr:alpha/beta fold hydrolase [Leptolyngbya sp. LK]RZM79508.1 alpha/beta fold hydrolase [Leptolyngbya sp. LK]
MRSTATQHEPPHPVISVSAAAVQLEGNLVIPPGAQGVVLFAHGSGSSRHSPRNQLVAQRLQQAGLATLLLDLLTPAEGRQDAETRQFRFDIDLLTARLVGATDWLQHTPATQNLGIGYFGASTGSAAAFMAATQRPDRVQAIVSRGGRPDLVGSALTQVQAPTLLIVGGQDLPVIAMNEYAFSRLDRLPEKQLAIVPNATHLFAEAGALEQVADLASDWFGRFLKRSQ